MYVVIRVSVCVVLCQMCAISIVSVVFRKKGDVAGVRVVSIVCFS